MNEELVSVGLYSLWDEEASRISVVFTDEGFVEVFFEKPRGSPPCGTLGYPKGSEVSSFSLLPGVMYTSACTKRRQRCLLHNVF